MRNTRIVIGKVLAGVLLMSAQVSAFAPNNFFPAYDPNLRLPHAPASDPWRLGVNVEWGKTSHGRNISDDKRNILQIYDDSEDMLAMFEKPTAELLANPTFVNLRNQLRINHAADDGVRGHVAMRGEFELLDVTPFVSYVLPIKWIPGKLSLTASMPVRRGRISDIQFHDLTDSIHPPADQEVKRLLTGSAATIDNVLYDVFDLDVSGWEDLGIGDVAVMLDWSKDYPQDRDGLRNVELHAKLGFTAPTAEGRDENNPFALNFGHDGAWSMPFGLGIDLDFERNIAIGAEAEFEVTFDHAKVRRMKTDTFQTSLLIPNKGDATKEHGFLWKFYFYAQMFHCWRGLSLKTAYEYVKHDDDRLHPKHNDFNASIANTDRSLGEWNMHNMIFQMNYDFFMCSCKDTSVKPQLSFFYKLPLAGKGVIMPHSIGGQFAINF